MAIIITHSFSRTVSRSDEIGKVTIQIIWNWDTFSIFKEVNVLIKQRQNKIFPEKRRLTFLILFLKQWIDDYI